MINFLQGDVMDKIKEVEDNSIDCVVTSPPYWGLRDYGTAQWEGGDPNCDHQTKRSRGDDIKQGDKQGTNLGSRPNIQTLCKCGAKRIDAQYGLEPTYQEHIQNIVELFRAMKPKLKDSATIWLNYGDCYATAKNGRDASNIVGDDRTFRNKPFTTIQGKLKNKDLVMMPNRIAIALQDDGWWIRSEIIWHKPNPMPESVTDRPTSAHEKIWLITKSKKYYYDADAIKEPCTTFDSNIRDRDTTKLNNTPGRTRMAGLKKNNYTLKNKRNVWKVSTKPFKEAHFATFAKDLIEPCIKAGCPEGGVVLDPFGGAGTTGIVAQSLNRQSIMIELNPEYIKIAKKRIENELGLFG
tara:strand:- start:45 stop:1100 length:1056 start_codon:yes stop_codon:yes gene_type:complete